MYGMLDCCRDTVTLEQSYAIQAEYKRIKKIKDDEVKEEENKASADDTENKRGGMID